MTKILMTSDLHLTDRPRDEYRFEVFRKLHTVIDEQGDIDAVGILGDITDAKDGHSAVLVNRITEEIVSLSKKCDVYLLKGNHDYIDETTPFMRFLGLLPNVTFVNDPQRICVSGVNVLMLPHCHHNSGALSTSGGNVALGSANRLTGKRVVSMVEKMDYDMVWIHQTLHRSRMANGTVAEGKAVLDLFGSKVPAGAKGVKVVTEPQAWWTQIKVPIVAGDVHVPQKLGNVTYIGAPYPVVFGDEWDPRFLLYDTELPEDRRVKEIRISSMQKHVVDLTGIDDCAMLPEYLAAGDQVKVRLRLKREEVHLWSEVRLKLFKVAQEKGVSIEALEMECTDSTLIPGGVDSPDVSTLSMTETLDAYCDANLVEEHLRLEGHKILNQ